MKKEKRAELHEAAHTALAQTFDGHMRGTNHECPCGDLISDAWRFCPRCRGQNQNYSRAEFILMSGSAREARRKLIDGIKECREGHVTVGEICQEVDWQELTGKVMPDGCEFCGCRPGTKPSAAELELLVNELFQLSTQRLVARFGRYCKCGNPVAYDERFCTACGESNSGFSTEKAAASGLCAGTVESVAANLLARDLDCTAAHQEHVKTRGECLEDVLAKDRADVAAQFKFCEDCGQELPPLES